MASKSANSVQKYRLVNERPKSICYTKFCDSCKEWRREGVSCHKCYRRCDVCNRAVSKKNFNRKNRGGGMGICDPCRGDIEGQIQDEREIREGVQVRRSLRKSVQESTAEGFYSLGVRDELDNWINRQGQARGRALNMAEKRRSQVPRYMHCDVCEEFLGIDNFMDQIGTGDAKVCDQCRVEVEAKAKGLQGCLFPKFPKAP